jgi:class 3 adenylate cyclase
MLPSGGTVTFLFTDIEGSTPLFQKHPDAMQDALARSRHCPPDSSLHVIREEP